MPPTRTMILLKQIAQRRKKSCSSHNASTNILPTNRGHWLRGSPYPASETSPHCGTSRERSCGHPRASAASASSLTCGELPDPKEASVSNGHRPAKATTPAGPQAAWLACTAVSRGHRAASAMSARSPTSGQCRNATRSSTGQKDATPSRPWSVILDAIASCYHDR